jgi:hypothetical protein
VGRDHLQSDSPPQILPLDTGESRVVCWGLGPDPMLRSVGNLASSSEMGSKVVYGLVWRRVKEGV